MDLKDYRKDYLEYVKSSAAADAEGTSATFTRISLEKLADAEIIPDFDLCYAIGKYGRKPYRVDAYSFDDYDYTMSLFIVDYQGEQDIDKITRTEANSLFGKLYTFLEGCLSRKLIDEVEISTPAYDLIERLDHLLGTIRKFRLYIITDKEMSDSISSFPYSEINSIQLEYHIWDINRFHRVLSDGDGHEPIEIDFSRLMKHGIPCIEAHDASTDRFKCYLCVLPGSVLADIYDQFGSRLLEGNVRSFLSTKVAVNRNIRATILGEEKTMFFAYNNGISATASSVSMSSKESGQYITSINNLQIVNGGQTTASLSNARYRDKADLEGIFVQMKLTEIKEHDLAQKIIPNISRSSNSQNKVSDADFFSNHEFNIRMQQISRRVYAPAVNGAQYETHWFFERSRGQYEAEQAKMSKTEQTKFKMQNPKEQRLTKTDFAKIQNTWRGYPHYVSMGSQRNFVKYAESIVEAWDKSETLFNEQYFKKTISLAIMFKFLDRMIVKQSWYDKGYKANVVTYSMAYLHYLTREQYPNKVIDLKLIWDRQKLSSILESELTRIAKLVYEVITDSSRPISNVTEWCKKEQCWISLKSKKHSFSDDFEDCLIEKDEQREEDREGKKEQKQVNGISAQTEVVTIGQEYWINLLRWGSNKGLLSEIETSFVFTATKIDSGKVPSDKQCQRILNIRTRMIEEGFRSPK